MGGGGPCAWPGLMLVRPKMWVDWAVMKSFLRSFVIPHIIPHDTWRQALKLSRRYLAHLQASDSLSSGFEVCVNALKNHIEASSIQIQRLA